MPLGPTLRQIRQDAKLTLGDVADRSGLSVPYLSDIERGNRVPNDNNVLTRIATAVGVQVGELHAAAAEDRRQFVLPYQPGSDLRSRVGTQLTRGWGDLSEEDLAKIEKVLRRGGQDG